MFALVLQIFWAKKPCKKSADLHHRQGSLLHRKIIAGLSSLCYTRQAGDQLKKVYPFFNTLLLA
jgi:hypothetical protein